MGTFFKECEHPVSRWSKCPKAYKIRYRNAAGKQVEESGFTRASTGRTTSCAPSPSSTSSLRFGPRLAINTPIMIKECCDKR
ncbi:hypothetical protein [Kitasatospora sp. NPDC093558]|uniref:hypothetical protein n=1 Tax=Kitasatospora sp. NPDC093558 TaxID=3155201 RepID=UPI003440DD16